MGTADLGIIKSFRLRMDRISLEITELTKDTIRFVLSNCDVSLANALRRVMISEVPTMAIHMVNIYENTSVLHDEFLTQRLALIPFVSESVDKYKYTWECDCNPGDGECQTCKTYFALSVKNNHSEIREVTSLDIEPLYENTLIQDEEKQVRPVIFKSEIHEDTVLGIPIVKLSQNQQINIKFDVQKGIGKMHSKWCPTTVATFHPEPEVQIDEQKMSKQTDATKRRIRDSCPTKVFEFKSGVFEVARPQDCIFCEQCKKVEDEVKQTNLIRIARKKDKFVFTVEASGVLPPVTIVKRSIQILRNKLKNLQDKIR